MFDDGEDEVLPYQETKSLVLSMQQHTERPKTRLNTIDIHKTQKQEKTKTELHHYVAREDETACMVAELFGLDVLSLVKLNKGKYPTLKANARLREGTKLRLPNPCDRHAANLLKRQVVKKQKSGHE